MSCGQVIEPEPYRSWRDSAQVANAAMEPAHRRPARAVPATTLLGDAEVPTAIVARLQRVRDSASKMVPAATRRLVRQAAIAR